MTQATDRRIAIFTSTMQGGGAQRAMMNLTRAFSQRGYQVDLVLARAEGPYMSDVPSNVRVVDLHCRRVLHTLFPLARYLRTERPAAMISSLDYVNLVAIWARRLSKTPLRLVVNEQNTLSRAAYGAGNFRNRWTPRLAKWFYPWADAVTAVSSDVREDLLQAVGVPSDRVEVVSNSVVRRDVLARAAESIHDPWCEEDGLPLIVAAGRLCRQKDYPTLIEAFAKLRTRQDARLLILGEGPLQPMIERLIRVRGLERDVRLAGFVNNPYAYMRRASLFVLSSRWEGLPLVLIEALCCGTPVVATDCPSGPREILREPRFGRLVPVGDPEALAAAMQDTIADPAGSPPEDAWQPYEIEHVADCYERVLFGSNPSALQESPCLCN